MRNDRMGIAVIGAGMAGILSAIKLKEAGLTDFTVYEKADRVGGTRGGCRKNAALAAATVSPVFRNQRFRYPSAARARLAPTNGRPAGCIGGTEERTSAAKRAGPD